MDDNTDLPKGWVQVQLGDITKLNPGLAAEKLPDDFKVSFLPMKAVTAESGLFDATIIKPYSEVKKGYTAFADGDILFAKITPCMENGKVAVVFGLRNGIGFGSTEFHVLRLAVSDMPARLIFFHLLQERFRRDARVHMTGSAGQLRVTQSYLVNTPFPLPPLPEQHRIVSKIEELFSDLDAGVDALKKTKALLKRYRQSVLKGAFEGKLTAKWRKANRGIIVPATDLLKHIWDERRKTFGKKVKEPPPVDTTGLCELPDGWEWTTLGMMAELKGGITKGERKSSEISYRAVPYLRVANVQRGFLNLSEMKLIEASLADIEELRLQQGDILFNEGGDRDKLGRGWVWNNELPECIHQNHVFRARLFSKDTQPKYVSYYGNAMGADYFSREGKQTTNLASINMTKLSRLPVPLAPSLEQDQILAEIERRFTIADQVEKTVDQSLIQSQRLRQSILKRAFSGRLVPQDPKDEPAVKLLERIKQQRVNQSQMTRGTPSTKGRK